MLSVSTCLTFCQLTKSKRHNISDWSKSEVVTDDNLHVANLMISVFDREKNIVKKRRKSHNKLSLYHTITTFNDLEKERRTDKRQGDSSIPPHPKLFFNPFPNNKFQTLPN